MTAAELLRAAENEHALPLLLHVLGKGRLQPDERQLAVARRQLAANALDGGALMHEVPKLIEALARQGVPVVLLKGASLRVTLYEAGLRPMGDIDFLIRPSDRDTTALVLSALGYRCVTTPGTAPDPPWEATWRQENAPHVWVEPHWAFWPLSPTRHAAALTEMWQRALPATVDGVSTRVLGPEDALLHFCVHLPAHEDQRWLVPVCDIGALMQHHEGRWDWNALVERARVLGVSCFLDYSLRLAATAIDAPVPPELLAGLRREHSPTADLTRSALRTAPGRARTLTLQVLSERGAVARTRLLIRWVFLPRHHITRRYRVRHTWLFWCLYPWRALAGIRLGIAAATAMAGTIRLPGRAARQPAPPAP